MYTTNNIKPMNPSEPPPTKLRKIRVFPPLQMISNTEPFRQAPVESLHFQ